MSFHSRYIFLNIWCNGFVFVYLCRYFSLLGQNMVPVLKYVRGEHLSQDHWLDMFRLLGLPRGTTLERLTFNDLLGVANTLIEKALELKVCTSMPMDENY